MNDFLNQYWWLVIVGVVWELAWKGLALWKAAKKGDKVWFVALLIINAAGILDIFYLFVFSKRDHNKAVE